MKPVDHFDWNYYKVPEHTQEALANYFIYKYEPGSFLTSVLCGDLYAAAARADHINRTALADIAKWIANNAPNGSWGSREAVQGWLQGNEYQQFFERKIVTKMLKEDFV